jgi:hypothetical protein
MLETTSRTVVRKNILADWNSSWIQTERKPGSVLRKLRPESDWCLEPRDVCAHTSKRIHRFPSCWCWGFWFERTGSFSSRFTVSLLFLAVGRVHLFYDYILVYLEYAFNLDEDVSRPQVQYNSWPRR